jgi:uncharacterized protein (DUF697 family)/uncharacterized tellurite resistance protein B-like protein
MVPAFAGCHSPWNVLVACGPDIAPGGYARKAVDRASWHGDPAFRIFPPMNTEQTRSILTVALMAAFADGLKDEREREAIRQLAESLGAQASVDLPGIYRDVLLSKPELATVVAPLETPELRHYAYEMAVGVISADGNEVQAETDFLSRLAVALQLPAGAAAATVSTAHAVNAAVAETPKPGATDTRKAAAAEGTVLGKANVDAVEMDKTILMASVTNAALELLPESIASMAIIPLQLRLVYRIGKAYGYEMDRSHARDFIATLGVGLTSQYVEQFGRKLLGGLLGGIGGGVGRAIGRQTASSALTFATTYAIGRVAQRYYAGGRTLDAATLKSTFASLLEEARGLAPKYQGQIERAAQTIDTRNLVSLIKQV